MGGRLAINFALAEPHRVASLVLVSASIDGAPSPARLPSEVEELIEQIERLEEAAELDAVNELEARMWLDGPSRQLGHVEGRARELFLDMNGRALRAAPTGEVDGDGETPAWQRLAELDVPVLAVVGAHDLPHIQERTLGLDAVIGGARTVVLAESARRSPARQSCGPVGTARRILRRHPASRAVARTPEVLIKQLVDSNHIHPA